MHAERVIENGFREAGWETERQSFAFENAVGVLDHRDESRGNRRVTYDLLEGANILASAPRSYANALFIIAAHFDTVQNTPGADDNASGVAALLELARVLDPSCLQYGIMLAATDMEEIGFFGARALIKELRERKRVASALVFESIGYISHVVGSQSVPPGLGVIYRQLEKRIRKHRFVGDWTLVIYQKSSQLIACEFTLVLAHLAGEHAAIMVREPCDLPVLGHLLGWTIPWAKDFTRGDHLEFWKAGIPAVQITNTADFRNANYHRPTDTPDTLDYCRLADIVTATAVAIEQVDRRLRFGS